MIIVAFGAEVLNNLVSGPSGLGIGTMNPFILLQSLKSTRRRSADGTGMFE